MLNTQNAHCNLAGLNKRWWCACVSLSECRSECDSCFNRNFCTRCRAGFYLSVGKCQQNCPEGMIPSDTQKECVPSECSHFTLPRDGYKTWLLTPLFIPAHSMLNIRDVSVFAGCPADCESCANSETCTQCRPGFYQLSGRCYHICPDDYEPNDKLVECTPQGQSSVSVC